MRIFSDESCVTSNDGRYLVIGALSCDKEIAKNIRRQIKELNILKHKKSEYHFTKVGDKNNVKDYQDLLEIFITCYHERRCYRTGLQEEKYYRNICFDALVIEHDRIDHFKFSNGDHQMGFLRFYHTLLKTVIIKHYNSENDVVITIDKIDFKKPELLLNLKQRLNMISNIKSLNPQDSAEETLLQLADVITGMISFKWNRWEGSLKQPSKRSQAKIDVIKYFEAKLGISLTETTYPTRSFNIWELSLK